MAQAWLDHFCFGLTLRQREASAARRALRVRSLTRKRSAAYDGFARMRGLRCMRQQCRHVADYHWYRFNVTADTYNRAWHGLAFARYARASV